MRRRLLATLVATTVVGLASQAHAEGALKKAWRSFKTDYSRNALWPQPWIGQDRASVYAPMTVMVAKGWMRQNQLNDEHFEPGKDELNEAGRMKVQQIMVVTPPNHRAVYVCRAATPELTAERILHVEQFVAEHTFDNHPTQVVESRLRRNDFPADYVDQIERAFRDSTPEPRIPPSQESTGGVSQSGGN
jgi:hypothetical protein